METVRSSPQVAQILGFGAGRSRATTWSVKPLVLCEPSQNGLLAEWPQRHRLMAVRPASPNGWPCGSTISKSPSILMGPLLLMVILVAAIWLLALLRRVALPLDCHASRRKQSRALR